MSWGLFVDVRLSVPAASWRTLLGKRPNDFALARGWSGLRDANLERAFEGDSGDETFADLLAWRCYHAPEAVRQERVTREHADVRVCAFLDKSLLAHAHPLTTLFEAVRTVGGSGKLQIVSDGTGGEDGAVIHTLTGGAVTRETLEQAWDLIGELGGELFSPHAIGASAVNPFTTKAGKPPKVGKPKAARSAKAPAKAKTKATPAKARAKAKTKTKLATAKTKPTKKATKPSRRR